jgi:hypothetical protein
MGFMSSYKHLEKLCGEVMNDERKVSAYIDEMVKTPQGAGRVAGWNEDLKRLKHYRWVRNQIVHEPDCTEENMCDPEDVRWLKDFYDRIMDREDPLALYRKATHRTAPVYPAAAPRVYSRSEPVRPSGQNGKRRPVGCAAFLLGAAAVLMMVLL